jgi:uncharacterized membrane protein
MSNDFGQRQSRGRLVFTCVMCLAGVVLVFMVGGSRIFSVLPIIIGALLAGVVFSSTIFTLLRTKWSYPVMLLGLLSILGLMNWLAGPWATGQIAWLFGTLAGTVFGSHLRYLVMSNRRQSS